MKAMVFIDGGWMVGARKDIFATCNGGESFDIDYAKLPAMLVGKLEDYLNYDIEVNRTHYFAVFHSDDEKGLKFLSWLGDTVGYEVVSVPSGPSSIDVAIASDVMLYGHLNAYDVAVICSDRDSLVPLVSSVRNMGKQVQFVTTKRVLDIIEKSNHKSVCLSDFPIVTVDSFGDEMRVERTVRNRKCSRCGAEEMTSWEGATFYCTKCMGRERRSRKRT